MSLNQFSNSVPIKEWMNVGCNNVTCNSLSVLDGVVPLEYARLNSSGTYNIVSAQIPAVPVNILDNGVMVNFGGFASTPNNVTLPASGVYNISYHLKVFSVAGQTELRTSMFNDGTVIENTGSTYNLAPNRAQTVSGSIIHISGGQEVIDVRVSSTTAGNLSISDMSLNIIRLH